MLDRQLSVKDLAHPLQIAALRLDANQVHVRRINGATLVFGELLQLLAASHGFLLKSLSFIALLFGFDSLRLRFGSLL